MYLGTDVKVDKNYVLPMNYAADLQVYVYCGWRFIGTCATRLVDMMVFLSIS